jgi:hypothetical protein
LIDPRKGSQEEVSFYLFINNKSWQTEKTSSKINWMKEKKTERQQQHETIIFIDLCLLMSFLSNDWVFCLLFLLVALMGRERKKEIRQCWERVGLLKKAL